MTKPSKRLEAMRRNPTGDWTIADVTAICGEFGVSFSRSRAGSSHYVVKHRDVADILTIPFARPIKPVYIRELVRFLDDVRGS